MKGKLIVFEGIDGSGKFTQSKLLISHFNKRKIPSVYISFPRYEDSLWGKMVRRYLDGDFGKLDDVDPYLASILYAGDRFSASGAIKHWLAQEKIIICNRYVGSNIGHMAAKFKKPQDRKKYIKWLEKLEYEEDGIPKEDLVILLSVPVATSKKLMKSRALDIHEKNTKYLKEVSSVYHDVAKSKKNWEIIDCTNSGVILPAEEIHKKVLDILSRRNILRTK